MGLLALWSITCRPDKASGQRETTHDEVARHMGAFYSAFVERDLTPTEVREVSRRMFEVHGARGRSREQILDIARSFDAGTKLLKTDRDSPAAQSYRDRFLAVNYFNPDLQNTTEQRLMTEADPVRVIHPKSKFFMTERDVVALINLREFARSNGPPRHRQLTPREIDEAVAQLDLEVNRNGRGYMTLFYTEASTFWAGLRRAWPELNAEQRERVRVYVGQPNVVLTEELYARLWSLGPIQAWSRMQHDITSSMMNLHFKNEMTNQSRVK
jgi:hypothetical protein